MTCTRNTPASEKVSLAPDTAALDERSARAWTERMAVQSLGGGRYAVEGQNGDTYQVDLVEGRCSCPDHEHRGERCKHLRRVAIEITEGRVPAPGADACAVCGAALGRDAGLNRSRRLCADCLLAPGELVTDRESGDSVLVLSVSGCRADQVEIAERGWTVADHPTNRGYDPADPVIEVIYPADIGTVGTPRVYSFPRSRLARRSEVDHAQTTLPTGVA